MILASFFSEDSYILEEEHDVKYKNNVLKNTDFYLLDPKSVMFSKEILPCS